MNENERIARWLGLCWHEWGVTVPHGPLRSCKHCPLVEAATLNAEPPSGPDYTQPSSCLDLIEAVRERGYGFKMQTGDVSWICNDGFSVDILNEDEKVIATVEAVTLPLAVRGAVLKLIDSEEGKDA